MKIETFIRRPILSTVISLFILLGGLVAMFELPVAQFPPITPPQVEVKASYPGASAEIISQTVAAPLEQAVNGVDDMLYMSSISSSSGELTLTVTFEVGTDPDQNTINVNNKVQSALSKLPEEVRLQGVTVNKKSSSILLVASLESTDGRFDTLYLSNYALVNVLDDLKRLPGVGDAFIFGAQDYAMRVWLKPGRLAQYDLTPSDVAAAIREQNTQFAAGTIGQEPLGEPVEMTFTVTTQGRMHDPEQFGNIILRADEQGGMLRLKDVARLELGAVSYNMKSKRNGNPAVGIPVFLAPGANALDTADRVYQKLEELQTRFPEGVEYFFPYDITTFVRISMMEVVHTLFEAMVLVFIIIYLFLQNWRATLIPCLAVPVSIVGAFAGMYALGFSINTLTLFGLVLAIGIVVDDAIVVIENVERIMEEEGLPPLEATIKAMGEVSAALVAIVLVLCSVFIPVAFMGGMTGEMYRQFAVTIAISVIISGVVALTLTPALCAILLKPVRSRPWFLLRGFNKLLGWATDATLFGVRGLLKRSILAALLLCAFGAASYGLIERIPQALVPNEDQGTVLVISMLPDGSSLSRTDAVARTLADKLLKLPNVMNVMQLTGFDLLSGTSKTNVMSAFISLRPWDERVGGQSSFDLAKQIMGMGYGIPDGFTLAFNPPPIFGMSTTGGVECYIQSREGASLTELQETAGKFLAAAAQDPLVGRAYTTFSANSPQFNVILDREKAKALGVSVREVFATMQATFGSYYVNDFNRLGRTFQVRLQSESNFRREPSDLNKVYVRSNKGRMIPLTALVSVEQTVGADTVERYNVFPAAKVFADPAAGASTGQLITALERVAAETLSSGYTLAWTGTAYQEKLISKSSLVIFAMGLLMIFLILAAQFERWPLPIAVVLSVVFALFGAVLANYLRSLANDIYFQVALVTLIGLSAKNAILIVEFALQQRKKGMEVTQAALIAARLRFRPIVMTSMAFVLGCLPLAVSSGAGAASRHSIGTGIVGGMVASTILAPLFVPSLYRTVVLISRRLRGKGGEQPPPEEES